jgi:hypothetical protein
MTSRYSATEAVTEHERQRVRLGRADVEEEHVRAVDGRRVLRVRVEPRLPGSPVVAVAPVLGQLATRATGTP